VKNPEGITVRYIGNDNHRLFCLQRGDSKYWTGDGDWSRILDEARIFQDHKSAQMTCAALQNQQYRGLPIRTFRVEVSITLAAEEVESIRKEALADYIASALRLDVSNSDFGDGPAEGSFVQARMLMATLEETQPPRKFF
jgi:hypothetical protein